jgi:hypothetical protein
MKASRPRAEERQVAPEEIAPAVPPEESAAAPESIYWGDRYGMSVWLGGAGVLVFLLIIDAFYHVLIRL